MEDLKLKAAKEATKYIGENEIIGVGTGTTVDFFIKELKEYKNQLKGVVSSSLRTQKQIEALGIPVLELNDVDYLPIYIDGADSCNDICQLTKGKGGALTREKILANASEKFICIIDDSKIKYALGHEPVVLEILTMARSSIAREVIKLKGTPVYRENFVTDNGNHLIDVYNWVISEPIKMEKQLNNIPGVIENGIFAKRPADIVIIASKNGIETKLRP